MQPYATVMYGDREFSTKVGTGRKPVFDFEIDLEQGDDAQFITIVVVSDTEFGSDLCGKCNILLDQFKVEGTNIEDYTLLRQT